MKKELFLLLVVAIALFSSCKSEDGDIVKIGAILPLTGKYADSAVGVKVGIDIAVGEINKKVGHEKYKVYYYDTASEPKQAITGYRQLRAMHMIDYFFTTNTDHSLAIKPMAIQDNSLLICIASHLGITQNNNNLVFRPCNTSVDEAMCIIKQMNLDDSSSIIAYSQNNDAGVAYKDAFEKYFNGNIEQWYLYESSNADIRNIISITKAKEQDCIVVLGFIPTMGLIIKALREQGYKGNIVCNPGFYNPSVINVVGEAGNGVKYIDYTFPYSSKLHKSRNTISEREYKTSFSALSYMSLVSVKIVDQIIDELGKPDIKKVGETLSHVKLYKIDDTEFKTDGMGGIIPTLTMKTYNYNNVQ